MADLNVMMREHAIAGLQSQLDKAVTDGDTAAARKVADEISKLTLSTAPKAPPFNNEDIKAELDKLPWFGRDPKKSARTVELGKSLDPKKFSSAADFAKALAEVVDAEFKTPTKTADEDPEAEPEDGEDEDPEAGPEEKPRKAERRTDGPGASGESMGAGRAARRASGPWTKISDAPREVQTEINRQADKLLPSHATKEQRETFVNKALGVAYAQHQRQPRKK